MQTRATSFLVGVLGAGLLGALAIADPGSTSGTTGLPDPTLTPGKAATFDLQEICGRTAAGTYSQRHRQTSVELKDWVMREYGHTGRQGSEIDHFWPLCAGGADEAANLWPMSYSGPWNAHDKDRLEAEICHLICRRQIEVHDAYSRMVADWRVFYIDVFGSRPPGAD